MPPASSDPMAGVFKNQDYVLPKSYCTHPPDEFGLQLGHDRLAASSSTSVVVMDDGDSEKARLVRQDLELTEAASAVAAVDLDGPSVLRVDLRHGDDPLEHKEQAGVVGRVLFHQGVPSLPHVHVQISAKRHIHIALFN